MSKVLLLLLTLSITLFANKKIVLQLNWLNQFQFAGYYIAKEKGFYKDVNLDVKIKEFTLNTNIVTNIKEKKADFAVGRSSLLIDKINGENIVALGAIFQESPLMLLVRKDSNINDVKDLKNKKIMITSDASFSASILAMLSASGIRPNDFEIQKHSFDVEDLINKKTDAMASYLSNEPIILKEKGIEYKIFHPADFGFSFYSDILFTSKKFIDKNPEITKNFYEASIRGWEYAFNNISETAEIIYSKYNTQNKSLISLIKEGEILKNLAILNKEQNIGELNKDKLNNIVNIFKLFGFANKDINTHEFIYEENRCKTMSFEISNNEQNIIIFLVIILLAFIGTIIFFLKKNSEIKDLLHILINSTDDLIFYKDNKFRYLGCNKSFERFVGKSESQIIGKNDFELFGEKYAKLFREKDVAVIESKTIKVNEEWLIFDNNNILFQTKKIPFRYKKNAPDGILGISRDITELHKINVKLKEQAYNDELTNIFNRKAFNEKIQEKLDLFYRYKTDFCIAMYDIDDFKKVNDTYGHDIGDKVLKEMSKEVKENIRKTDQIFRVGGEEFVVIFPKTKIDEAFVAAEKIRIRVSQMRIIEDRKITISIGISQTKENDTIDSIYERIDRLMYESKHKGKNQTTKD